MPKLPQISSKKLIKALQKDGWYVVSQKGSHIKLYKDNQTGISIVIIPNHKTIKKGTLSNILKSTKLDIKKLK
jgi:predicted RNA binding protein YcfA (HicA-like mRNA interferase family)